jgi:hypothetical protein
LPLVPADIAAEVLALLRDAGFADLPELGS